MDTEASTIETLLTLALANDYAKKMQLAGTGDKGTTLVIKRRLAGEEDEAPVMDNGAILAEAITRMKDPTKLFNALLGKFNKKFP